MIDSTFIEKIEELAKTEIINIDGRDYATKKLSPVLPQLPDTLHVSTLTALADYLKTDRDGIDPAQIFVHVENPLTVSLISRRVRPWEQRAKFVQASYAPRVFPFGRYIPVEEFIVNLQTYFIQDETTALLTKIVGNLTAGTKVTVLDDGISQEVQAKSGISMVKDTTLPNPVELRPYRTFMEVKQPASKFLFRMNQANGISCALFEADGGNWQLEALANISTWLEGYLDNNIVIMA